ncbi:hypothetical protein PO909_021479 [Leuciscus waleckii]
MPLDRTLDLSSRQLRRFPARASAFNELVKLYLSDNHLSNLPSELRNLQKLQLLALDFNRFEELPLVVCSLVQLNILYLGNNRLYGLPKELRQLTELKTFPRVICQLPNIKTLHLGYNQLRSLPSELGRLEELRSIWLAGNVLNDFPPVLLKMHYLEVIDVDRNRIQHFPSLAYLRGLKLVIYDHNPCVNAPVVAEGVRRVGRWADSSDGEEDEGDGNVVQASVKVQGSLEDTE